MTPYIVSTVGLLFDIFGAFFVAFEVVRQFNGEMFKGNPLFDDMNDAPKKTESFEKWEISKYKYMKIGLTLLVLGFITQGIGLWFGYLSSAQQLCK